MYSKPELLSPAGDFYALIAAVQNGADAVYLGGKGLNARRGAGNFDREEMKKAADYLHERGKKMYVTVNTMVKQAELPLLYEAAETLAYAGADAAIVQDYGVCAVLREMLPSLPLHASTQMAVNNVQGAKWLKQQGFERAVLAREMSYEEIAACREEGIDIEVFCHGALCVACSGQCLFSSIVGGRSGNRGACAQPCRLPYTMDGARNVSGYLLSPRDLMTAGELDRMKAAGVTSLKIEGRLKRPEYVAVVTGIYRRLLDGEKFTDNELEELRQIFNRGGFTTGYASGIRDGEFISGARPSHWGVSVGNADSPKSIRLTRDVIASDALVIRGKDEVPVKLEGFAGRTVKNPAGAVGEVYRLVSAAQMEAANESFRGEHALIPVKAKLVLKAGKTAYAEVTDGMTTVNAEGPVLETALKPTDIERVKQQFLKTGGTPYAIDGLSSDIDADAFAPVSVINALRRECLEKLSAKRIEKARGCESAVKPYCEAAITPYEGNAVPRIAVQASDVKLLKNLLSCRADEAVYFPEDLRNIPDISGMFLYLPPVMATKTLEKLHEFACAQKDLKGVYISNPGCLAYDWPGEIRYDFAMNLANSPALGFLDIGENTYTPSIELTAGEINRLPGKKELIVYGRVPLMHLRHCPLNAARNGGKHADCRVCDSAACGKKLNDCTLTDRMKARFPLKRLASDEGCVIDLMNSVPINLAERFSKLPKCKGIRLIFSGEDIPSAKLITGCFADMLAGKECDLSRMPKEHTTGHYFRGVE